MSSEVQNTYESNEHDDDPQYYSAPSKVLAEKRFYPIAEEWDHIDQEIVTFLRKSQLPEKDRCRIYHGFPDMDSQHVGNPIVLWVSMPRYPVWVQRVVVGGIKTILVKHSFPDIGVECVKEDQAYLLIDPPKLPGVLPPRSTFDNDIVMGASFGRKGVNHSATIGGQIIIETTGTKPKTCRFFVSAFHPFLDIVSERLQTSSNPHEVRSGMYPIVIPSEQDKIHVTYQLEYNLVRLKSANESILSSGMERAREEQLAKNNEAIKILENDLVKTNRCTESAGFLSHFGKFKTQSKPASNPSKTNRLGQKEKQALRRQSLSSWPIHENSDSPGSATQRMRDENSPVLETTLDWCLIEPAEERVMHNSLPGLEEGQRLTDDEYCPDNGSVTNWSTKNIRAGQYVIKRGRTTAITVGMLNKAETVTVNSATKHEVWSIDSLPGKDFLLPGDSGSWAIDMEGNWIGLLTCGSGGDGSMLPIDDLIGDIEQKCQCKVIFPKRKW